MTERDRPRFEEQVRAAAGGELRRHLASASAPAGAKVLVRVLVRTETPLTPQAIEAVRETLEEVRAGFGDVVTQVYFEVTPGLPDGYDVRCEPVTNAGAAAEAERPGPRGPLVRQRLLTFAFGGLRFDYLLAEPADRWLPLQRPADRRGGIGFVLPQSMAAVPSGPLLSLRMVDGELMARRTWERPEIAVLVNDALLHPNLETGLAVAPRGWIGYQLADTGQALSRLEYELADWAPASPTQAGTPDTGDGSAHEVWLTVDNETHPLRIAPPEPGNRAAERRFPIQSASPDGHSPHLDVQVLYTRGQWRGPREDQWHVKVYRCATPQHADQLRRYLRTQAALVDTANAAVGGTGQAPPWAVAPVTLVQPGADYRGELRRTELAVTDRDVSDDPENRLSAWFGVPEQPQPHCYVIAVSPMLRKVGWADSSLRRVAPGLEQLDDLVSLAQGLDRLHELGIAHCDVKPENVCRNQRDSGGTGYVLIDSDAVCRTVERLVDLRLTPTYAAPRIMSQWRRSYDGQTPADLREHDRFGFALVVLGALAGSDRVAFLVQDDEDGRRPIDQPTVVTDAIRTWWPDPRWARFTEVLAAPFQYDALVGDQWSAVGWLRELDALGVPAPEPVAEQVAPVFAGEYAGHLHRIRAEVRSTPRGLNAWVPAVLERVAAHQDEIAHREFRRVVWLAGALPLLVAVVVLIGVVAGR
ncbi:hypothetical protein UO65_4744 [Actinokineospora spheciospongiae]|uniref:Protein kinase domain-containing protein n=1 Tax=Actinokineospora spheciospongiae TaxID=909613 RepID=W7J1I8_9PSEU|nr:hypothetical protein [Actinokineospora spheciospongiae]EWC59964.1 hypothetical protein UO65_4744 [Actinokineospora spheciospongiae]